MITTIKNLLIWLKKIVIFYILKKQILINFFLFFIRKLKIEKNITNQLLKVDFHQELNKNIFFTTRSLIFEIGNFTSKKEYPNLKTSHRNKKNQLIFFVKSSELKDFVNNFLNKINENFILVSGDSDTEIRIDNMQKDLELKNVISKILNNKKLVSWYSQNLFFDNNKVESLPHGLDFHTVWEKRKMWEEFRFSPSYQEKKLITILNNSKHLSERKNLIYNNWHFSLNHGNRKKIFDEINREDNFFPKNRINRFMNWELQSNFRYIFCPSGKGLDDPRIYESIILGNIPIRVEDELSKLHENLPVVNIKNLEELNVQKLDIKYLEIINQKFNFQKLFLDYWRKKLDLDYKKSCIDRFENISMLEFRNNIIQYFLSH